MDKHLFFVLLVLSMFLFAILAGLLYQFTKKSHRAAFGVIFYVLISYLIAFAIVYALAWSWWAYLIVSAGLGAFIAWVHKNRNRSFFKGFTSEWYETFGEK